MFTDRLLLGHVFMHNDVLEGASTYGSSPSSPIYYPIPTFNRQNRYDPTAPYNLAPDYSLPKGFGLPLAKNFDYNSFIKTTVGNNTETNARGLGLPLFIDLPNKSVSASYQWDSFPAGEAQQFLVFSVSSDTINKQPLYNGETLGASPVVLDALSSSNTERPFTISLSVTPYNAGPIPHIHWAEDEWFIILQGEMDSWIGDPTSDAYNMYEFPAGSAPLSSNYDGPILTADNVSQFYYGHLTEGQSVYLPRGYAHAYRNASPSGDPLVFLTIWSRTPGYPTGGIEQFFTLPDPLIGRFYSTSDKAASYGNLFNKNVGSTDGISNQQRFVDYYNTFPDYFVAMSRNFGSFTSSSSAGGNWNPGIPYDTQPIPNPPPAYWQPSSSTPWLASSTTPGAQQYYLPPGPNAPSQNVNFATPFDPTVVQVCTFTYTGPNDAGSIKAFEHQLTQLTSALSSSPGVQYSILLNSTSTSSVKISYVLQTTWDTYSSLSAVQSSTTVTGLLQELSKTSTLSTSNNTVNSDIEANNQQMVVGRFQIKPGSMDQVLAISAALKKKTIQESGNISFDYYIDELDPNKIVYIEQYTDGAALTAHLTASYTTLFFSQLGPLTLSGLLGDGVVGIYPVNSQISQFYPTQIQGVQTLNSILQSMPDLHLTLVNHKGQLTATNPQGTANLGGFIKVAQSALDATSQTYGYLDPITNQPVILFEQDSGLIAAQGLRDYLTRDVSLTSGIGITLFSTSQSAASVMSQGLKGATYSSDSNLIIEPSGTARFQELTISLDVPYQGIQYVSSKPQSSAKALIDLTQVPRRDITGSVHLYDATGQHIDSSGLMDYGVYQVNDLNGSIRDPLTGNILTPRAGGRNQAAIDQKYQMLVSRDRLSSTFYDDQFIAKGGSYLAPYLEIGRALYTPYNCDVDLVGSNCFAFNTPEGTFLSAVTLLKSDQVPLLA